MNGLKFIRKRCNLSMTELGDAIGVSRQQISAWENNIKPISEDRLNQLSEYFGIEKMYFLDITEEQKDSLINKALYLRQNTDGEKYTFDKPGEIKENFEFRPIYYPEFDSSIDEKIVDAKKRKQKTMSEIEEVMHYFNKPKLLIENVGAINRACEIYDCITSFMKYMPEQSPGMSMVYYYQIRNVLLALLKSHRLITEQNVREYFEEVLDVPLYNDGDWILELSRLFENYFQKKEEIYIEMTKEFKKKKAQEKNNDIGRIYYSEQKR